MSNIVPFAAPLYSAKQFTAQVDGKEWLFSGTLCGNVDMATTAGTFCLTPREVRAIIAALQSAQMDVLQNSNPNGDPRIVG